MMAPDHAAPVIATWRPRPRRPPHGEVRAHHHRRHRCNPHGCDPVMGLAGRIERTDRWTAALRRADESGGGRTARDRALHRLRGAERVAGPASDRRDRGGGGTIASGLWFVVEVFAFRGRVTE